jgi:hypothetical protein
MTSPSSAATESSWQGPRRRHQTGLVCGPGSETQGGRPVARRPPKPHERRARIAARGANASDCISGFGVRGANTFPLDGPCSAGLLCGPDYVVAEAFPPALIPRRQPARLAPSPSTACPQ